jgi:hypothetical protein
MIVCMVILYDFIKLIVFYAVEFPLSIAGGIYAFSLGS